MLLCVWVCGVACFWVVGCLMLAFFGAWVLCMLLTVWWAIRVQFTSGPLCRVCTKHVLRTHTETPEEP